MLYPIIVHQDEGVYEFTAPDFPSCFSLAETQEEIRPMLQDVVQLCMEETGVDVPVPSKIEEVAASEDAQGGFVMLVDLDFSFLDKTKTTISMTIPLSMLNTIDRAAKAVGKNRSQYLAECGVRCAPKRRPQAGA